MKPSEYWNDHRTEREFEESGLQCCTRTMDMGHRCGYVALPEEVWDGMAAALRGYIESLDELHAFMPNRQAFDAPDGDA